MADKSASFDSPENVACVEKAMAEVNFTHARDEMNRASDGSLDVKAARNVVRLVGLAALRQPGRAVFVAGAGAQVEGDRLVIYLGKEIGEAKVPKL